MKGLSFKRKIGLLLVLTGLVLIGLAAGLYALSEKESDISASWEFEMEGVDGQNKLLTYSEIKNMPSYSGTGGFFSTTGAVTGPFHAKGVLLESLCALVGGLDESNLVKISAADGYSTMLDYQQVKGGFITYDPLTLKEKPHGELRPLLMYEKDGHALDEDFGKPLRLAIAGEDGFVTEGLYWTKWINKVEIIQPKNISGGEPRP
ncbi:MAG: molybdopterin-dependent oxidoreductase [Dehalococcoidales bacterium]|nr:molybdopterin-dependent oxidoreductase [Dehalococcoidales bacterium]